MYVYKQPTKQYRNPQHKIIIFEGCHIQPSILVQNLRVYIAFETDLDNVCRKVMDTLIYLNHILKNPI